MHLCQLSQLVQNVCVCAGVSYTSNYQVYVLALKSVLSIVCNCKYILTEGIILLLCNVLCTLNSLNKAGDKESHSCSYQVV